LRAKEVPQNDDHPLGAFEAHDAIRREVDGGGRIFEGVLDGERKEEEAVAVRREGQLCGGEGGRRENGDRERNREGSDRMVEEEKGEEGEDGQKEREERRTKHDRNPS
jgi:hypothetical protein